MGIDLHGEDVTNAAKKAAKDAISRADLSGLVEILNLDLEDVFIDVTIACPFPQKVKKPEVEKIFPVGKVQVKVVDGGLIVPGLYLDRFGETSRIVVAVAGVVVKVDTSKVKIA